MIPAGNVVAATEMGRKTCGPEAHMTNYSRADKRCIVHDTDTNAKKDFGCDVHDTQGTRRAIKYTKIFHFGAI